jgi:tetratricopeptide (TPR) repeat protein
VVSPPLADAPQLRRMDDAQRELLLGLVREAIESGHPDSALRLLDQLWSADLSREDCWYLRGQALYQLSRFQEAGQVTQQGLIHRPQSIALLFLLCSCELKLNNLPGAERAILEAIGLFPDHPVLLCRYANLLARAGRTDEARRLLDQAENAAPGYPLIELERKHLRMLAEHRQTGAASPVIDNRPDVYARPSIGLSLLGLGIPRELMLERSERQFGVRSLILGCVAAGLTLAGHWQMAALMIAAVLMMKLRRRSQAPASESGS